MRAIRASGEAFCCRGCASVFTLLRESGLDAFYGAGPTPGVSQRKAQRAAARFAALDLPEVRSRFVDFDDGERACVTFAVPDLHCASCLWLVERLWRVNDGIVRAEADLVRRTVRVWFRPSRITLRGVAEQLAAIGYEPLVTDEAAARQLPPARRRLYVKLAVAGFAFGNIMLFSIPRYINGGPLDGGFQQLFDTLNIAFAVPVLLYSALEFFSGSWRALKHGRLTLDVPIALGLAVMFGRSVFDIVSGAGEGYMDSFTGLVFFLLIGRLLQHKAFDRIAFDRSFRSFLPLSVLAERGGALEPLPLEYLRAGDRIVVRPHEIIPAGARLLEGDGSIDYAFVTGESTPVSVKAGDVLRAGGRVSGRSVRCELIEPVSSSRLAALWNDAAFTRTKRSWLAAVTDAFGATFTVTATLLAISGAIAWWPDTVMAMQVATAVLIIACPCAITLAAPITLGTAMEMLGRRGLYLKHGSVALDLARTSAIAFDKTGTLTTASGGLQAAPVGLSDDEWRLTRRLAAESVHPVSRAIAVVPASGTVTACVDVPGRGLRGIVDGHRVVIGSRSFVAEECGRDDGELPDETAVAIDGIVCGSIRLRTPERPGIDDAVRRLTGSHDVWMISGDHEAEQTRWQQVFGARMSFRQSPEQKLARITEAQAAGSRVLMVGDGLNDAAALAAANVGMAVSDDTACIVPACDAVIRGDRLETLPALLRFARQARYVVIACFVISILYNIAGLSLALAGRLTPLVTAVLMPISSLTILALGAGGMRWFARRLPAEAGTRA